MATLNVGSSSSSTQNYENTGLRRGGATNASDPAAPTIESQRPVSPHPPDPKMPRTITYPKNKRTSLTFTSSKNVESNLSPEDTPVLEPASPSSPSAPIYDINDPEHVVNKYKPEELEKIVQNENHDELYHAMRSYTTSDHPQHGSSIFSPAHKVAGKSDHIRVYQRRTGILVEEKIAIYVRLGMEAVFHGKISNALDHTKAAQKLFHTMSKRQGLHFDSPKTKKNIIPFVKFLDIDTKEIADPIEKYQTFNQFFYRKLNPLYRPLSDFQNRLVVSSPADCRTTVFKDIDEATKIWVKGKHFTLSSLLGDEALGKTFTGGSLGIFRLAPQDYHRFHMPIDGVVNEPRPINGTYYTVNPIAVRSNLDVFTENKRVVSVINSEVFGKVAYVCVGALLVGSIVLTSVPGEKLVRGLEHGYFAYGGSTVILLFEKGSGLTWDADLHKHTEEGFETIVRVGEQVGKKA